MSEWWTYSLSDFLLFSPRTYYRLFELYNLAIWPAQLAALAAGIVIVAVWRHGGRAHGRMISGLLAGAWQWVAWAYLLEHYDTINWAASYFAIAFVLQALLLAWFGIVRDQLPLAWWREARSRVGLGVFVFALLIYPLLAPLLGRGWLQAEIFGVAPDPTVVATLGILLAAERPTRILAVIPLLWCAVSGATLWTMGSREGFVLPAIAILTLAWMGLRRTAPAP